jgi:RNA polymerase sigma-70 factor, ECF subfamily
LDDFRGNLRAAQRGDQDAFACLWRQFQPGLIRYLRVKSGAAAEDLAADTWLRVVRALPTFEGDENGFRGWLFTTARNRLTDWYRKGSRRDECVSEYSLFTALPATSDVELDAEEHSTTDAALALIAGLPADQAEAVMLRIVAGLEVSMVATIMDRTPGSVRVLCHRGLRRLEQTLAADGMDRVDGSTTRMTRTLDDRVPAGMQDRLEHVNHA